MIILLTGSSASGKTTIGKVLAEKYAFQHIDGDQVIKDLGLTSKAWNSIHDEIIKRSIALHSRGNVVISHVVLPDTFQFYLEKLALHNIESKIVVLRPTWHTLLARSNTRTSHPRPTPKEVIDFFSARYEYVNAQQLGCYVIDNSQQTTQKTVTEIVKQCDLECNLTAVKNL